MTVCPDSAYTERNFLIFSNLAMVPAIMWCCMLSHRHRNWKLFACELINMSIVMVNSMFYHACDVGGCAAVCLYAWETAFLLDFTFSYNMIPTVLFYLLELEFSWVKVFLHLLILLGNFSFVVYVKPVEGDHTYFAVVITTAVILVQLRLWYLHYKGRLCTEYRRHFHTGAAFSAALCSVSAVLFMLYEAKTYWIYHSLWHIFIMSGLCFTFHIYASFYQRVAQESPPKSPPKKRLKIRSLTV